MGNWLSSTPETAAPAAAEQPTPPTGEATAPVPSPGTAKRSYAEALGFSPKDSAPAEDTPAQETAE